MFLKTEFWLTFSSHFNYGASHLIQPGVISWWQGLHHGDLLGRAAPFARDKEASSAKGHPREREKDEERPDHPESSLCRPNSDWPDRLDRRYLESY